ncbi:Protein CBG08444 [Caenorhabditis briggsae]|uniref:Protein CBG08444 n=1 Tax=Caenorhabditis briggsae TaxID=6238 RepID=A8X6K4_CAEBR|nr:Protein CBG08444 [Caenorhabditis briggsae]CAP28265.2 Protein CBG08444 [Caenorhabditis briggsae]
MALGTVPIVFSKIGSVYKPTLEPFPITLSLHKVMRASPHRQTIAKLFNDGISTGDIARRLLLPRATVYRVVQQLKDRGHVLELKKSGRPRSVNTRRTRGIIKKRITRNDAVSMNQMASSLGISRQSVQSIVNKDLGLNSYRLLRGQYLTEQSKKNRLEKAKKCAASLKSFGLMRKFLRLSRFRTDRMLGNCCQRTKQSPQNVVWPTRDFFQSQ